MRILALIIIMVLSTKGVCGDMAIIPSPLKTTVGSGSFTVQQKTAVSADATFSKEADYLAKSLGIVRSRSGQGDILLTAKGAKAELGDEGYVLEVTDKAIITRATARVGAFHGIQSLIQMLPPKSLGAVPACTIEDKPKYRFRSFMLDSGRQYHTVDFIKKYLDLMALYKFNVFHWHLTEGAGWRLEIKRYPKLTEVGSKVANGKEQQGFYTQEQVKEVVQYAADRHIMVVPEIDVPGHSTAALIAYPEMCCAKRAPKVQGISRHIFCGGRENVFEFLEGVFPRLLGLSQQIWNDGKRLPFKQFYPKVQSHYPRLKAMGVDYGPALKEDVPKGYSWE